MNDYIAGALVGIIIVLLAFAAYQIGFHNGLMTHLLDLTFPL